MRDVLADPHRFSHRDRGHRALEGSMSWLFETQEGAGVMVILIGVGVFIVAETIIRIARRK
jgi:ribosome maturation protein Sdo1